MLSCVRQHAYVYGALGNKGSPWYQHQSAKRQESLSLELGPQARYPCHLCKRAGCRQLSLYSCSRPGGAGPSLAFLFLSTVSFAAAAASASTPLSEHQLIKLVHSLRRFFADWILLGAPAIQALGLPIQCP